MYDRERILPTFLQRGNSDDGRSFFCQHFPHETPWLPLPHPLSKRKFWIPSRLPSLPAKPLGIPRSPTFHTCRASCVCLSSNFVIDADCSAVTMTCFDPCCCADISAGDIGTRRGGAFSCFTCCSVHFQTTDHVPSRGRVGAGELESYDNV